MEAICISKSSKPEGKRLYIFSVTEETVNFRIKSETKLKIYSTMRNIDELSPLQMVYSHMRIADVIVVGP